MNLEFQAKVARPVLVTLDVLEQIQASQGTQPPFEETRTLLKRALGPFDVQGAEAHIQKLARRAIIYWMDELLVNANWRYALRWNNEPLERELLGTRNRAKHFYDDADAARGLERLDAFEVFALCAALGFQGVYRGKHVAPSSPKVDAAELLENNEDTPDEAVLNDDEAASETATEAVATNVAEPQPQKASVGERPANDGIDTTTVAVAASPQPAAVELPPSSTQNEKCEPPEALHLLPGTFEDWVATAFAQVCDQPLTPFVPYRPVESARSAKALSGRSGLVWWISTLSLFVLITVLLLIFGVSW